MVESGSKRGGQYLGEFEVKLPEIRNFKFMGKPFFELIFYDVCCQIQSFIQLLSTISAKDNAFQNICQREFVKKHP